MVKYKLQKKYKGFILSFIYSSSLVSFLPLNSFSHHISGLVLILAELIHSLRNNITKTLPQMMKVVPYCKKNTVPYSRKTLCSIRRKWLGHNHTGTQPWPLWPRLSATHIGPLVTPITCNSNTLTLFRSQSNVFVAVSCCPSPGFFPVWFLGWFLIFSITQYAKVSRRPCCQHAWCTLTSCPSSGVTVVLFSLLKLSLHHFCSNALRNFEKGCYIS